MNAEELSQLLTPLLEGLGVELVELQLNRSKKTSIRLFVWEQDGISIDRCSQVSRQVSDFLDRKNVLDHSYVLEVSSPGIDRKLVTERDFQRQLGRMVRVERMRDGKVVRVKGVIHDVSKHTLVLETSSGYEEIPLQDIVSAKVMVEF